MTATLGPMLLNWQLLQAGFSPTVIQVEERARYLGALDQGHAGNLVPLHTFITGALERRLDLAAQKEVLRTEWPKLRRSGDAV